MMRHVSGTHRVALDWLFDKIHFDPKIQNKFVDLSTKGSFTRGEWCHLLCLVNIMDLSMSSCSHVRAVEKATTMPKIIQERKKEEDPAVAKPRSVCLITTSLNKGQSSSFGLDASNIRGIRSWTQGLLKEPRETAGKAVSKKPRETAGLDIVQYRVQNPETCSQVLKGDNPSPRGGGGLEHHCHQTSFVTSRTRQSRSLSIAW